MISQDQLDELEKRVQHIYSTGQMDNQNDLFDTWFKNAEYFEKSKFIIESQRGVALTHFAIRSCSSLLDYVFQTWEPRNFFEMSQWCLGILSSQAERFVNVPILSQTFCNMYGHIVMLGWHISEEFQVFTSYINFGQNAAKGSIADEAFWQDLFQGTAAQWAAKIRSNTSVVEYMSQIHHLETDQLNNFKDKLLFQCFDFGIKTLEFISMRSMPSHFSMDDVFTLIDYSLQLLMAILSFDDIINDSVEKTKIVLPPNWAAYRSQQISETNKESCLPNFPNVIKCLFDLYETCTNNSPELIGNFLKCIFLFGSIHSDVKSRVIIDRMKYLSPFFEGISHIIQSKNSIDDFQGNSIPFLLNIIVNIMFSIKGFEDLIHIESFPEFISSVFKLTQIIFTVEFLSSSPDSIINILKFWNIVSLLVYKINSFIQRLSLQSESSSSSSPSSNMPSRNDYEYDEILLRKMISFDQADKEIAVNLINLIFSMIGSVCSIYIKLLQDFINQNPKGAHLVLFSDLSQTCPLMTLIFSIGRVNGDQYYLQILDIFQEFLNKYQSDPTDIITEMQLCLFAMIISPPVIQKAVQINKNSFFDSCLIGIIALFKVSQELIDKGFTHNVYVEELILFLITQFIKSQLIRSENPLPQAVNNQTGFGFTSQLHSLFATRISLTMRTFSDNEELLTLAIDVLEKWVNLSETIKNDDIILDIFTSEFLAVYDTVLEKIFDSPKTKHDRIKFHQIVGQILSHNPNDEKFYPFFQKISARFQTLKQEPDEFLAFGIIVDLYGILQGVKKGSRTYLMLFSYIYPMLEIFHQAALKYFSLVNPYLKFLAELTKDRNARISFSPHSADGLKLAKIAMSFLITFFDNISRSLDQSIKGLLYAIKIMKHVLTSSYSNLGAIIAYDDPILVQMFSSFLNYAHAVDFNGIIQYPKQLKHIISLLCYLFSNFTDYIIKIDISFLRTALIICTYSNNTSFLPSVKKTFSVISNITNFCVNFLNSDDQESSILRQELYENTKEVFNVILLMLEGMILKMPATIKYKGSTVLFDELIRLTQNVLRMKPTKWPEVKQRLALFLGSSKDERHVKTLLCIE